MKKVFFILLISVFSLFALPALSSPADVTSFEIVSDIGAGSVLPTNEGIDVPTAGDYDTRMYNSKVSTLKALEIAGPRDTGNNWRQRTEHPASLYAYNMPASRSYEVGWR